MAAANLIEAKQQGMIKGTTDRVKEVETFASKTALAVGGFLSITAASGLLKRWLTLIATFRSLKSATIEDLEPSLLLKTVINRLITMHEHLRN